MCGCACTYIQTVNDMRLTDVLNLYRISTTNKRSSWLSSGANEPLEFLNRCIEKYNMLHNTHSGSPHVFPPLDHTHKYASLFMFALHDLVETIKPTIKNDKQTNQYSKFTSFIHTLTPPFISTITTPFHTVSSTTTQQDDGIIICI